MSDPVASPELPQLVEPETLQIHLDNAQILIVDLSSAQTFADAHIPGAIRLDFTSIIADRPPAGGTLPDLAHLEKVFSAIGLTKDTHVVAYDRDGNAKASRLLWTLDVIGHQRNSLLNGGFAAWIDERRPVESGEPPARPRSVYHGAAPGPARADKEYILAHLNDPKVVVVDCRSAAEFTGADRRSARPGHIPGAVNFDWANAVDRVRATRLKEADELLAELAALGVTPDKEAIVHCQTHQRSAHTYMALKALGFARVRGYDGSWSEWGNDPNLPIEV